jgi:hypothetical protein
MVTTRGVRTVILGALLLICAACDVEPPAPGSELATRAEIASQASALLKNERFEELDALADTYRSTQARTSSGLWKLGFFYSGLSEMFPRHRQSPEIWALLGQSTEHWIERRPRSPAARLVYATILINQAWGIRGTGYANTVEQQQWKPFFAKVEEARAYLEGVKTIASADPYWYRAMLEIATMQEWPDARFSALLAEALDRHPLYYDIYFEATNRKLPKWGGSAEEVEAFAREAVRRTHATEGAGLYARIYWSASGSELGDELFKRSHVDWAEMKRGIDDVLAKYPDEWNLNHFAKLACLAGDYPKAAELIDRIEGDALPSAWGMSFYMTRCRLRAMLAG